MAPMNNIFLQVSSRSSSASPRRKLSSSRQVVPTLCVTLSVATTTTTKKEVSLSESSAGVMHVERRRRRGEMPRNQDATEKHNNPKNQQVNISGPPSGRGLCLSCRHSLVPSSLPSISSSPLLSSPQTNDFVRDKFTTQDGSIPLAAEILAGGCVSTA